MKINKYIIPLFGMSMLITAVSSCSKDDVEVIEQNTAWNIDPKYEEEDIRNSIGEIPTTPLAYFSYNTLAANGVHEDGKTTLKFDNSNKLFVKFTKAMEVDTEVKFVVDEAAISASRTLLPAESYNIESVVVKAGEISAEANFQLTNPDLLTEGNFDLPLRIETNNKDILGAKERGLFKFTCNVAFSLGAIDKEATQLDGDVLNSELFSLESNVNANALHFLTDGDKEGSDSYWNSTVWKVSSSKHELTTTFKKEELIKGIKLYTYYYYPLKDVKIYTIQEGKQVLLGVAKAKNTKETIIVFKEPMPLNNIILSGFTPTKSQVSVSEIEFIK